MTKREIKEQFDENGFIVLKNVFPDKELKAVRELTDRIVNWSEEGKEDPFKNYFMRHRSDQGVLYDLYCRHPEFRKLVDNPTLLDALAAIVGENYFLYENSLIYKPKGKQNEVPWHQDFMNRTNEPTKYIVWMALDNVTLENGALKFIPGSHKKGFLSYHKVRGETHHTRLNLDDLNVSNFKYGLMDAGDILIFHHLVVHGSDLVDVTEPRRAYRIAVQGVDQVFTPRSVPIMLHGGQPNEFLKYGYDKPHKPDSLLQKVAHKIGRRFMEV